MYIPFRGFSQLPCCGWAWLTPVSPGHVCQSSLRACSVFGMAQAWSLLDFLDWCQALPSNQPIIGLESAHQETVPETGLFDRVRFHHSTPTSEFCPLD
ncbi:hypothetical protein DPEC_G00055860 [Dallia pectoralis]|uniref:Uncharacterized protein n=1 Tax=Dallia pectoralis TaxID=75939 RepID=A0ACC2H5F8_DALPE|nr:hypothetical protein DPEC_G00055860 [Dallia pectoralis]